IAFKEPDRPQEHKWWSRLALGEGLTDYALGSTDLAADAEAIRGRGLDVTGPVDGGRQRPDGARLAWRTILLGRGAAGANGGPALPFVIEDVTPRERRVPGGAAANHRLSATGVAGLTLVVSDLTTAGARLEAVLGARGAPSSGRAATEGTALRYPIGQQWLELLQPANSSPPAGEYLRRFGDGPYEVVLNAVGSAGPGAGQLIEGNLHGARIRLAG
ncbi:MAG: VOC family protein, partial [Chloroflexota bacterium]